MKTKYLFTMGAMAALFAACADDYEVAQNGFDKVANRPSAGNVVLNTTIGEEGGFDADTRVIWDNGFKFQENDRIGAFLYDEFNETNIGNTSMADYTFVDYNQTNYPFQTTDGGSTWKTPDNAALCEGNYFFTMRYESAYKDRAYVEFSVPNVQKNYNEETGEHDVYADYAELQQRLGYAFIPATTEDVNEVSATFVPIFASPGFKIMNHTGLTLKVMKLIVRTHKHGPAGMPSKMPTTVVLAPKGKQFSAVQAEYPDMSVEDKALAMVSNAVLVKNGFFADTDADTKIDVDENDGVYEYVADMGDNYMVKHGSNIVGQLVMPAGDYKNFDVYALVQVQDDNLTTGIISLTNLKNAAWSGLDTQNGSMDVDLRPQVGKLPKQMMTATIDAGAIGNLGMKDFAVTNTEDLMFVLNLMAKEGGNHNITVKTLGDQVELTNEVYAVLSDPKWSNNKLQIDGTIVIPASLESNDGIDILWTDDKVKTTIINRGVQVLDEDLVADVINEGSLTEAEDKDVTIKGDVTNKGSLVVNKITGDVSNAESGVIDITTVTGDVENAGNLTIKTINGNLENGYNATVETVNGDVNNYDNDGELVINNVNGKLTNTGMVTVKEGELAEVENGGIISNSTITIEEETVIKDVTNNRWGTIKVNANAQIGGDNLGTINIAEGVTLTPYQYLNNESDSDGAFFGIINVNDADLKYIGSTTIKNNGVIYVKGKSHVAVNSGYGIIDVTEADATGGYQASSNATTAQVAGMTTYFRYRITTENNSKSVTTATLQKIISSKNYGINPIILEFEADATQAGLSGANVDKILVKSGATLSLEGEWWLENTQQPQVYMMGDSYNALEVEEGATLQILNGKTLTAGQAFTATVDGKMRAENASKVQGDVTIDGTGVVEVATADFSWTKGTFSGDWTK